MFLRARNIVVAVTGVRCALFLSRTAQLSHIFVVFLVCSFRRVVRAQASVDVNICNGYFGAVQTLDFKFEGNVRVYEPLISGECSVWSSSAHGFALSQLAPIDSLGWAVSVCVPHRPTQVLTNSC
jgi:hypothetical protein